MGVIFYNLFLRFYRLSLGIYALFNPKAADFLSGRKNLLERIQKTVHRSDRKIWFHCASLGEFEQGRPIIEEFRRRYPGYKIILTFFSPSGYNVRKHYQGADHVYYLPLDGATTAKTFVEYVNPDLVVFIKYEFWHYYFKSLSNKNIPIILVSAIFRHDQIFFKWYGGFNRKILRRLSHVFTQDKASVDLLHSIGFQDTSVSGDTRFDRVWKIREDSDNVPFLDDFKGSNKILVIGSCWKEDLEVIIPFINNAPGGLKFIVAPHEITEKNIRFIESEVKLKTQRYSKIQELEGKTEVIIIDSIGQLSKMYKYGEFAFIGGAFKDGLHNILEAATFGLPIFFGDQNFRKFREAIELIELGGATPVKNYFEFNKAIMPLLTENQRKLISDIVYNYVRANTGATDIIMKYINSTIHEPGDSN